VVRDVSPEDVSKKGVAEFVKTAEVMDSDGRRKTRKKKNNNVLLRAVIGWSVILLGLVGYRYWTTKEQSDSEEKGTLVDRMTRGGLADETVSVLTKALPECHRALAGFLMAGTPEARNQFVVNPVDVAGKMALYYARNPFPKVDVMKINRVGQTVVRDGENSLVVTRWKEGVEGGAEFDVVFREEAGRWKMDWEHFSQYGDYPWALFLSGDGPSKGEFRLLARVRKQSDEVEESGARISFVLLTPIWGKPNEVGMESPEFVVDRRSDEGLLMDAAFERRREGLAVYENGFTSLEPAGLIRVRVTVKRTEIGDKRRFSLEKVHACHWGSSSSPGFDLKSLKEDMYEKY
jgi:hypothetical protein